MHFIKLLLIAISVELLCCFGIIEKEKPLPLQSVVIIDSKGVQTSLDHEVEVKRIKRTPIEIKVQ